MRQQTIFRVILLICSTILTLWLFVAEGEATDSPPIQSAKNDPMTTAADFIDVIEGDMPLLLAVGHAGYINPGGPQIPYLPYRVGPDPLLREMYTLMMQMLDERIKYTPYVVYNKATRPHINTNDQPGQFAYDPNNKLVEDIYYLYHGMIDEQIGELEDAHGNDMGLMINLHTTSLPASLGNKPWDRIADIGTRRIQSWNSLNSMFALCQRRGEAACLGNDSLYYKLYHAKYPDPEAVWPSVTTKNSKKDPDVWHVLPAKVNGSWVEPYMNGYTTVQYHGTNTTGKHANWKRGLDAFQIEFEYTDYRGFALPQDDPDYDPDGPYYQLNEPFAREFLDDFIDAILSTLEEHYNWVPADRTLPTGSITIQDDTDVTTSTLVSLSLSASDSSGVSLMKFSNDGLTFSAPEPYTTTQSWQLSEGNGLKTVYATYADPTGNWSQPVSDTITLDVQANLSINKDFIAKPGVITYTLAFTNQGPSPVSGVYVTDIVPPEISHLSVLSRGVSLIPTPNVTFTWLVSGELAVGQSGLITLSGQYSGTATVTNTASIEAWIADVNPEDNQATVSFTYSSGTPQQLVFLPLIFK